ncbi:MAG: hypothetical protein CXT69_06325 [Methanobacteriota archaeon]|nr:MAG: hypothetical protein CXT69_06325 [Euryarchaeota archaeon]
MRPLCSSPTRLVFSLLIVFSMVLSGCFGNGGGGKNNDALFSWDEGFQYIDDPINHMQPKAFNVTQNWAENGVWDEDSELWLNRTVEGDAFWAEFTAEQGGNCCEHYLAATKEGWLMNFGGEYPTWSEDRGHTWQDWKPTIVTQLGCRTPKLTVPGQEGLGEGSIVQTTTGDIISMGWFPYPSTSGGDQFYAFLYDADDEQWGWCYNRLTEPFYDRSWQVEVVGPISSNIGNGEWASLVISNFWHQSSNRGGQISVDGLNYYYFEFPDKNANIDEVVVDLNFDELGPEWDFTKPHKEMRAFPVPSGGLYFPSFFDDGGDAFLDTSLDWYRATTAEGNSLPSEYCSFDSSTALHCVIKDGDAHLTHMYSMDGGENWTNQSYNLSNTASGIEEWEFHSNGVHDLFVLNVRYQSTEGPDIDVAWHVRDVSESLEPDSKTFLGLGNLDSTSGAGNDIRFDFASMGIMNDGGAFIAYHDASDPDPLFALELYLPEVYGPAQA